MESEEIVHHLVENSKSAIFAAVEIHNKPVFPYRYEVSTLLVINAWELALKAYIIQYLPKVIIFYDDGTTKPFDECVKCVFSNLEKEYKPFQESIFSLYNYRNDIAHFYSDDIEIVIYSLLKPNIEFFIKFLKDFFSIDLSDESNLVILPIGFVKPYSPIDFISNNSSSSESPDVVKNFIEGIVKKSEQLQEEGIEDSILVNFSMNLTNEKRIKNADIITGITNNPNQNKTLTIKEIIGDFTVTSDPKAKKLRIQEESVTDDLFPLTYQKLVDEARERFTNFKTNKQFYRILSDIKQKEDLHYTKYLDKETKTSKKDYYSPKALDELAKFYEEET